MSGYVKAGASFLKNLLKGAKQKTTGTEAIKNVPVSPNLKKFQEQKDQIIKTTDKYTQGLKTQEGKTNVRKFVGPALGRVSKLTQKFPKKAEKKAKGGRVGLKRGTFPDLNKDGKTTFADVLIGRGVLPKGKKKKTMAKKSESPMDKAVKKKNKKRFV